MHLKFDFARARSRARFGISLVLADSFAKDISKK
jgi:hypothetical protein